VPRQPLAVAFELETEAPMKINILKRYPRDEETGEFWRAIEPKEGETVEALVARALAKPAGYKDSTHLEIRLAIEHE